MKLFKLTLLVLAVFFSFKRADAQNALINILSQNSGVVKKGKTGFLEITINNTDPSGHIGIYKLRPQINFPSSIVSIESKGHVLPTGWTIVNNDGSSITLSNGMDMIAANDSRTILVAIKGNKIGGPSTVIANLNFSDGNAPGSISASLSGDNPADNSSKSTFQVIK